MGLFNKKHSVGKTIATLRKEKGWTQVELAEKLQVSDKAVSKWEKDDAFPSVEFFPALAELFGVSIDYLMTGKKAEPQVITMSKAEFCAKNNNAALVKEIDCTHKDENGKTLIDYILKYECLDVFVELCTINKNNITKFQIDDAVKLCILSNRLDLLTKKTFYINSNVRYEFNTPKEIMGLLPAGALEHLGFKQGMEKYICLLPDDFFQMIIADKRIKQETLDFILSKQENRQCVWYHAFPYLIHQCYENNSKELLSRLLTLAKENNDYAYSNLTNSQNYSYNYFFIGFYNSKNGHGLVRILEKTIKLALERGDFDLVSEFNKINANVMKYCDSFICYVANNDEIRIAKLKLDKSVSAEDLAIQSAIENGVICIDKLLAFEHFETIKKAIFAYPIHRIEILAKWYQEKNWRELFHFAVDNNDNNLSRSIVKEDVAQIEKVLLSYWKPDALNGKYYCIIENGVEKTFFNTYDVRNIKANTIEEILALLQRCRQRILDELSLKMDKEKTTGELTRQYFEKLLKDGDTEMLIIKLCVRLEAILRCDYHYEGDFSEMLKQYCDSKLHWREDDGWGYMVNKSDDETIRLLHKLRMKRNGIVHSEKCNEELSIDELQKCISHICSIG